MAISIDSSEQMIKILNKMLDLITIEELLATGKKKGRSKGYGPLVDLKKEKTRLKHQIRNYIKDLSFRLTT